MKKFATKSQTFRQIIEDGLLYADKTRYIYNLIRDHKFCFLSRPRRFGKTLLLDTLQELFQGNQELFKGLWIDPETIIDNAKSSFDTQNETILPFSFKKHPIIRLDMAYDKTDTPEELKNEIIGDLREIALQEGIAVTGDSFHRIIGNMTNGLTNKYGERAILLVDEYDSPVTDHINNYKVARANSKVLHNFYRVIKSYSARFDFGFVTGISRFAMTSLESGPNNFSDISMDPEYAGVCGFTIPEFDALFADRMDETLKIFKERNHGDNDFTVTDLRRAILEWYDGYNWLGPDQALNPFSIIKFFTKRHFSNYWIHSGRPFHLETLIQRKPMDFIQLKLDSYTTEELTESKLNQLEPAPVLFHSGYLTIDRKKDALINFNQKIDMFNMDEEESIEVFFLKIPNKEVKTTYKEYCFRTIFGSGYKDIQGLGAELVYAFSNKRSEEITILLDKIFGNITYWRRIAREKYYHGIVHASLLAAGLRVESEKLGRLGRSDLVVILPDKKYVIIEIKYLRNIENNIQSSLIDALDGALEQIEMTDYSGPYRILNPTEIIGLGIVFYGKNMVAAKFWKGRDLRLPPPLGTDTRDE
ncbi:MAG: ATP-binding protein [Deltaproteobacteria bacterium]|jgi:hypothetical protein|nr:ATP-binding protein [Deltaproteobacteria bacterium]